MVALKPKDLATQSTMWRFALNLAHTAYFGPQVIVKLIMGETNKKGVPWAELIAPKPPIFHEIPWF